uniref:RNase H type-1 domain-containing protein n=1 Tax=Cannabis sativa TaxID=3483 RepID=A0A803PF85_CANSA
MQPATESSMYLGLPSTMGRNKTAAMGFLLDKVRKRLQGWEGKLLSKVGKEVLVKSVAQALPSYAMSVFLLPIEITRDIKKMITRFWWQSSGKSSKGIHWLSWDRLSKHKDLGGMGFRNFRDFNLALLGKQGWRLLTRSNSLVARVFKARYYPNGSYLSAELGNNPSFVWRSVLEAQSLVAMGVRWCIGTGENISVLGEPWLQDHSNPCIISDHPALVNAKVSNLMHGEGGGWDLELINDLFLERDRGLILAIPINLSSTEDHLTWHKDVSGSYTVRSAYNLLQESQGQWHSTEDSSFWKSFWKLKVPPKAKNTVWRAAMNCLPTTVMLQTKKVEAVLVDNIVASANRNLYQWRNAQNSFLESSWSLFKEGDGVECWSTPSTNSVKINVDAALFGDEQGFGIGAVARDDKDLLIEGVCKHFQGKVEPLLAQALGVKEALSWIKLRDWQQVLVETDCMGVVQALKSSLDMVSLFGCVINDCNKLLSELRNVSVFFVKRSGNKVAHAFAKASLLYPDCIFHLEDAPVDLLPTLVAEFDG